MVLCNFRNVLVYFVLLLFFGSRMLFILFQVISLELSTGIPMLYIVKEEKYIRRGSPAAPSEAGVYAYTKVMYNLLCSKRINLGYTIYLRRRGKRVKS